MSSQKFLARGGAVILASAVIMACSDTKDLVRPLGPADPLFASYVALGNSLTAGFQSGGINDSTQHEGYAELVAQQMRTPFVLPSLASPGCPPPIDNLVTQHRVGDGTASTCAGRTNPLGDAVINDVAVPGANSFDPVNPLGPGANNALTTFILGGKTQVTRALDASPTFVSVWIGNNDALPAALSGIIKPLTGVSPGLTPLNVFAANYAKMTSALTAGGTIKGGVLIGVVDVTQAAIFFPAPVLFAPGVQDGINQATGKNVIVDTSCTPSSKSLINFQLIGAIAAGTQQNFIACHPLSTDFSGVGPGQIFVLDSAEVAAVSDTVAAYNAYIKAKADSLGWAFADPNPTLADLRARGFILPFPNLTAGHPFGAAISLDGIHPSAAGQEEIANLVIDAINAKYGTQLQPVTVTFTADQVHPTVRP